MACFEDNDLFDFYEEDNVEKAVLPTFVDKNNTNEAKEAVKKLADLLKKRANEDTSANALPNKKAKNEKKKLEQSFKESLPRISVHAIETVESCTHEVAVPPNTEYIPLEPPNEEPAKKYSFILDPFQKESVLCIDNDQSVLVSAHTSAGKTVVAEYAIAKCLKNKQRVIYTTPIKALSNQKYRDFSDEFSDVGLMTGDVTINPNASCLIMTTEILRSMLYRGSEVTREVGWVIFDEIHYMRDKERGYVWEETIILLAPSVHFVFLSATIPNASQFAQWICHLHHQPCHVVYTDHRPTPLQHFIFPSGDEGIYLVVDETGKFREDNFNTAMTFLQNSPEQSNTGGKGRKATAKGKVQAGSDCFKIVNMIMKNKFDPAIIFSFSKKECEKYALQMSKLEFGNSAEEKRLVDEVFKNAMEVLSEEDKKLPQVQSILPLLRRGIGIHHGGLLPIIKETIEILFGEGLIKVLFATETFAMGLNMPARTVVFTSVRKFDGKDFRWVTSGEYIQMSGRAGRRGKDDKGIVIMMVDEKLNNSVAKNLVQGQADPINSAFHLTYNMVLNLLRVEEINPEYILERSFFQFQNFSSIPQIYDRIEEWERKLKKIKMKNEHIIESYCKIKQTIQTLKLERQTFITKPIFAVPFLQTGRLVRVKIGEFDYGWGIILGYNKKEDKKNPLGASVVTVDVLLNVSQNSAAKKVTTDLRPPALGEKFEPVVVPTLLNLIQDFSAVKLKLASDLNPLDQRLYSMKMVQESIKRVPEEQFFLDPVKNMKIKDKTFLQIVEKLDMFKKRLISHKLHTNKEREELCAQYDKKAEMERELSIVQNDLKKAKHILHLDELKCRKRVLRRLKFATAKDVIEKKGRVACELSAADELLLTEMLFSGIFNELNAAQTCALLSTFVCDEKSSEMPKLGEKLSGPLRQMQDIARTIAKVCHECKLEVNEEMYVEKFRPYLMDVVHEWCNGATFLEICKKTDLFEGSIIRGMRRLEELLRQMVQASKAIGIDLEQKFVDGVKLIKRDIIFAASLYL